MPVWTISVFLINYKHCNWHTNAMYSFFIVEAMSSSARKTCTKWKKMFWYFRLLEVNTLFFLPSLTSDGPFIMDTILWMWNTTTGGFDVMTAKWVTVTHNSYCKLEFWLVNRIRSRLCMGLYFLSLKMWRSSPERTGLSLKVKGFWLNTLGHIC